MTKLKLFGTAGTCLWALVVIPSFMPSATWGMRGMLLLWTLVCAIRFVVLLDRLLHSEDPS